MANLRNYLHIDTLINIIDEPARSICVQIMDENRELFQKARGSTHNHQTWEGGYIDHVTDCMNYAKQFYDTLLFIGRPLSFSLSDALLILFLHDVEKPWRIVVNSDGAASNRPGLETKEDFKKFREEKLREYGLVLTSAQQNALTYVEGEYKAYSSKKRVMNELAAFCHIVDTWSARGAYDYPKASGDEWGGAGRFRN